MFTDSSPLINPLIESPTLIASFAIQLKKQKNTNIKCVIALADVEWPKKWKIYPEDWRPW